MPSLISMAAVGVGGLALYRAIAAKQAGVPLDFAFNNPWRSIDELKALLAAGPPSPTGAATVATAIYNVLPATIRAQLPAVSATGGNGITFTRTPFTSAPLQTLT